MMAATANLQHKRPQSSMASMNQQQVLQFATQEPSSFGMSPYQIQSSHAKKDRRPISEAQQAIRQALHSNLN